MIDRPWYKKWWGILFIFLVIIITANIFKSNPGKEISEQTQILQKPDLKNLIEIENRYNEYQKKLKEYYPNNEMFGILGDDISKLTALADLSKESQPETFSKIKSIKPKVEILRRVIYAKGLERTMLDKVLDVEVSTKGKMINYSYSNSF